MHISGLDSYLNRLSYVCPPPDLYPEEVHDVQVVFSDLVTAEFRNRKSDPEFPMGLDSLENFLHCTGYFQTDYAFPPAAEVAAKMARDGRPFLTLGVRGQRRYPVRDAGVWAINVMNYLQAPAFFSLLDLAGAPALRTERRENDPIVVLGGHIWPNPLPLSHFYDVMVVGDGEDALSRIVQLRADLPNDRAGLLRAVSRLDGCFVPGYTEGAVKRVQIDFEDPRYAPGSSYLLDGVGAVVLSRGCPHSCVFCNSAFIGGRYRVKPFSQIIDHVDLLRKNGARKIMLIAATASQYRSEGKTVLDVMHYIEGLGMSVRSMSDRPENLADGFLGRSAKSRGKLILAPESSPRIRKNVLRKTLTEETMDMAVSACIAAGIHRIQLYLMVAIPATGEDVVCSMPDGFPGEEEEDVKYMAELAMSIADRMKDAGSTGQDGPCVKLDCMPFVPAIGTGIQQAAFPSYRRYARSIKRLKSLIRKEYDGLVRIVAGMDRASHLLQAFLERNDAGAGLALWEAWKGTGAGTLDMWQMLKRLDCDESDLFDEDRCGRLPYAGMIEE